MKHLSNAALFRKLKSHEIMQRVFAAEELGARRNPAAVPPLLDVLAKIETVEDAGLMAAGAVIDALAAIGDRSAIRAILEMLRLGGGVLDESGDPVISDAACKALVALRATAVLPELRALQTGRYASLYGGQLARVLVDLGGAAETELFVELLGGKALVPRLAAAEALGRLRHLPSIPALEALLEDPELHLRLAALGALLAMEQPGAEARLRAEMLRASTRAEKAAIRYMLQAHSRQAQVGIVLELADDPRWADSPTMFFNTLELAVVLGCPAAVARLRQVVEDLGQSSCARARAAGILLGDGDEALLPFCLEFLRQFRDGRAALAGRRDGDGDGDDDDTGDGGPRTLQELHELDDRHRHLHDTQREVLIAVRDHAQRHREVRALVADVLLMLVEREDESADDLDSMISYLAGTALVQLTGTCSAAELARWRAAQRADH